MTAEMVTRRPGDERLEYVNPVHLKKINGNKRLQITEA